MFHTTYISFIIIGLNVLISYYAFSHRELIDKYAFNPYRILHNKEYYRILTSSFLHANPQHLLFNMLSLYLVGRYIESILIQYFGPTLGSFHFLMIYFGGAAMGTVLSFWKNHDNPYYQSIGASGAVSAAIFAFIMWMPNVEFYLFFAIPMKAYIFGILFLGFEYFAMARGKGHIAHDVHFVSAIFGVLYVLMINFDKGKDFFNLIF